ncbi:restriction endonuclease subunit S [Halomonas sp. AOP43-D1-4]|uniref:restriction endonuclease subunit S n=1 Tax=Halomonas sp. AOP43-D1-4 TaxID=3457658 RepID=UPI004033FCFC
MSANYLKTTIGAQLTLQRGFDITKKQQQPGTVPVVSSGGVSSFHNESKVTAPGVVLGRKGSLGTTFLLQEDFWPHDTTLWVKDFKDNNPVFVYYFFLNMSDVLKKMDVGAANPALNRNHVHPMEVWWPVRHVQDQIAEIMSALDRKLTNNNQINQTLEQMAQAIFKSWFVDFEPVKAKIAARERWYAMQPTDESASPVCYADDADSLPDLETWMNLAAMQAISGKNEVELTRLQTEQPEQYAELRSTVALFPSAMQESELGEIPEGWECLALDQIAKYQNGLALQKFRPENEDNYLPVVKIAQLKKGYADHEEKASPNIKPDCIIENGDVVFSWSGSLMVDTWCGGRAALNQHLFKVTSETYPKWLYFYFTRHHLEEFQRIAADKAVTMGHIKREHLKRAMCAVPDGSIIRRTGKTLENILNEQIELRLETTILSILRDALLPKLLSGQITLTEREDFREAHVSKEMAL